MADEINYAVGNAAVLKIQGLWRRALVRERTYLELKAVWEKILCKGFRFSQTRRRQKSGGGPEPGFVSEERSRTFFSS